MDCGLLSTSRQIWEEAGGTICIGNAFVFGYDLKRRYHGPTTRVCWSRDHACQSSEPHGSVEQRANQLRTRNKLRGHWQPCVTAFLEYYLGANMSQNPRTLRFYPHYFVAMRKDLKVARRQAIAMMKRKSTLSNSPSKYFMDFGNDGSRLVRGGLIIWGRVIGLMSLRRTIRY